MRILLACEESQAVTIEMRKLGHEAFSCDLLPCSGGHPEWHLQQDVTELLKQKWDMIIAFPPCTDLCVSGAKHFALKQADGRQQRSIDFFKLFTEVDCDRVAIENPIGIMSNHYRKPDQIIQPYMFGDPVKKSTCLWLKGLPKLVETNNVESDVVYYTTKDGKGKQSEWNAKQIVVNGKKCGYNTPEFKKHRSKTFEGIAKAMAMQWAS
jgi:site-specific DNA-cytosine methylase